MKAESGTILKIRGRKAYVFTDTCRMRVLPAEAGMQPGQILDLPDTEARQPARTVLLRRMATAAAALVLLTAGILLYPVLRGQLTTPPATALVSVDINPSLHLELDGDYTVRAVDPLNEEARDLARTVRLRGLDVREAVRLWIAAAQARHATPGDTEVLLGGLADDDDALRRVLSSISLSGVRITVLTQPASDPLNGDIALAANQEGISVGFRLLALRLDTLGWTLSAEEFQQTPLAALTGMLDGPDPSPTPTPVPTPSPSVSSETTPAPTVTEPEPTATPTPTLSPSPTPTPVPAPTTTATKMATPTPIPTTTAPDRYLLQVTAKDSGLLLQWDAAPADRSLNYYKVVISRNNPAPSYPDDGYLAAISKSTVTSFTVDNSKAYNGGDFGGYLTPGDSYYFSITYVMADGSKQVSKTVKTVYTGPAYTAPEPPDMSGMTVTLTDAQTLSWTRTPTIEDFKYYKVVFSVSNDAPMYPDDGYLYALSADQTSCTFAAGKPYSGGDVGDSLVSGQEYHVSITYVFRYASGDEYYASNTIPVTVP